MDNEKDLQRSAQWDVAMEAVYLISCALHDRVPDVSEDLESLFHYCQSHSVAAMVAMALESGWRTNPPKNGDIVTPWKQVKEKAIRKNILLNAERQRILAYLDSIGCWYLPLKGSFLQHDYPKFGMRQMSDNDILYDVAMDQQVRGFMVESGYTVKAFGKNNHDEYTKPPVYNFEMHRRLFSPLTHPALAEYYSGIRHLMVKDADNRCGYHLSDEDFYVYMIAHAYKHYFVRGTGIRTLVDVYVFLDRHGEKLDWTYVETEIKKLGITDYERQCRSIAPKLFDLPCRDIPLSEAEAVFLEQFLGAGTYGSRKQAVENALDRMQANDASGGFLTKMRYFWQRMFPPLEFMAELEPDLLEHRWKLPFAYLKRLLKVLFLYPMRAIREMQHLIQAKTNRKKK